jgi:hypothetical protein
MDSIFNKIERAVRANCEKVKYVRDYPMDFVLLTKTADEIIEDDSIETLKPLADAMQVILDTIKEHGTDDDDIRVCFCHLPGTEDWAISIGDGR